MLKSAVVIILFVALVAARGPKHRVVNGKQIGEIINGKVINPGTFPYITYIRASRLRTIRLNSTHIIEYVAPGRCAGTIIRENAVLTAAHCVSGTKPENVTLIAGVVALDQFEQSAQVRIARRFVKHEQYAGHWEYDIAVIFVSKFDFNKFVGPLTLAKPSDYSIGMAATASGWGRNVNGTTTTWLNSAEMTLMENSVCEQYTQSEVNYASLICVMDTAMRSKTCYGDSGGPLVKNNILVGVLNGGIDFRDKDKPDNGTCIPDYPSAYTKVSDYWSWITTQLLWDTLYLNNE